MGDLDNFKGDKNQILFLVQLLFNKDLDLVEWDPFDEIISLHLFQILLENFLREGNSL